MGKMNNDFRILLAVDLKTGTSQLLAEAERYVRALNAVVDLIHVADPDPDFVGYLKIDPNVRPTQEDLVREDKAKEFRSDHEQLHTIAERLKARGVRIDRALMVQGPILETILEHVSKLRSDLLILGAHQHGVLYRLWYGDTAADAVKHSSCALLIVPAGD
jgi:nucleotide-binding universal stress UspA family protein